MNTHAPSGLLSATGHDVDWQSHLPEFFDPTAPPVGAFDAFAQQVANAAGTPYAMLNWVGSEQFFLGLANPSGGELPVVGRAMPLTHGFCPHVVQRRGSLVLTDVLDFDEFAGNPVVDEIGVRVYGEPLSSTSARTMSGARSAWSAPSRETARKVARCGRSSTTTATSS